MSAPFPTRSYSSQDTQPTQTTTDRGGCDDEDKFLVNPTPGQSSCHFFKKKKKNQHLGLDEEDMYTKDVSKCPVSTKLSDVDSNYSEETEIDDEEKEEMVEDYVPPHNPER
jgi:hypothetical protein